MVMTSEEITKWNALTKHIREMVPVEVLRNIKIVAVIEESSSSTFGGKEPFHGRES